MSKIEKAFLTILVLAVAWAQPALAQVAPATILEIDVENSVNYLVDISDLSRFATDPNATTATPRSFGTNLLIADIVAVNGRPAKGTCMIRGQFVFLRTNPTSGQAIADTVRDLIADQSFEILHPDGRPIGTIIVHGLGLGPAPPGAPLAVDQGNNVIVGGTGAFLGVRGQSGGVLIPGFPTSRRASVTEDPANRRTHGGGGKIRFVLHVIPQSRPEIVPTSLGPAVTHSNDFTLVTASRPAAPGEILALFATGLGPTRPGVDPGQPFPASPLAVANSPVEVIVTGKPAQVFAAVGLPGTVGGFQVNFRLPSDVPRGPATVQVRAAWIAGQAVTIPVQ